MHSDPQTLTLLVRAAWVLIALAVAAPLVLKYSEDDSGALRFLRSRARRVFPIDDLEVKDQMRVSVRVSLFMTIPLVLVYAYYNERSWALVIILLGALMGPLLTIPFGLVHTIFVRFFAFRGALVSTAAGLVMGSTAGRFILGGDVTTWMTIYGAAYGMSVAAWRHVLTQPLPDEHRPIVEDAAEG